MKSIFIFSSTPLSGRGSTQFFNMVIAENFQEARELALGAQNGRIRRHLATQMQPKGVYENVRTINAAFRRYYPHHARLPLGKSSAVLLASNGQAELA